MIIELFSQSYNPQFVFSSSDIPYLFSDCKDLSYSRTSGKSYMQCLRVSLNLFLLCCILFPLGFLNNPIRSGCCGCWQFPFSSIIHQINYFFPAIVPNKTSQLTHPVRTRLAPSHWPGAHPFRVHAAYMAFRTAAKHMFVMKRTLNIFPVSWQIFSAFLYRVITSFTMVFYPGQELLGCKKLIFINILAQSQILWDFRFLS